MVQICSKVVSSNLTINIAVYSSSYDTARAHFLISLQRFGGKLISPYPTHFPVSHSFPVSGFRVGLRV